MKVFVNLKDIIGFGIIALVIIAFCIAHLIDKFKKK